MIITDTATHLIEEMFVQIAKGATVANGSMTLVGASPSTLYFSDRPERVVGHMTTAQFVGVERGDGLLRLGPAQRGALVRRVRCRHPQRRGRRPARPRSGTTRSPTRSKCSTVSCRRPPAPARCSSIHLVVRCHPFWSPACIGATGAGCAVACAERGRRVRPPDMRQPLVETRINDTTPSQKMRAPIDARRVPCP